MKRATLGVFVSCEYVAVGVPALAWGFPDGRPSDCPVTVHQTPANWTKDGSCTAERKNVIVADTKLAT